MIEERDGLNGRPSAFNRLCPFYRAEESERVLPARFSAGAVRSFAGAAMGAVFPAAGAVRIEVSRAASEVPPAEAVRTAAEVLVAA